jgi:hypothetical protein
MKFAAVALMLLALPASAQTAKPVADSGAAEKIKAIKADTGVKAALAGKKISGVVTVGPDFFVVYAGDCQMFVETSDGRKPGDTQGKAMLVVKVGQKACKSDKKDAPNPKVPG